MLYHSAYPVLKFKNYIIPFDYARNKKTGAGAIGVLSGITVNNSG